LDGWNRTAVADQRDHTGDGRLIGAPTKEGCTGASAEGLTADVTDQARSGFAVTADVALADLSSCRTVQVRTEYLWRTHRALLVFGDIQDIVDTFATFSSADGQTTV
jgi:hypothetical protein